MSKSYRIQEFAALAGVTVKTLRHYDRLGLLQPRRTDAGYRLYSERDLERLEQIVALRYLGFPLKEIRIMLDQAALGLAEALRRQRQALEHKRSLLSGAIAAIADVEKTMLPGQTADPAILKKLIEVIGMELDMDAMKQYFTEGAWEKRRRAYEEGPSKDWIELFGDVEKALGEDPASDRAQALAERWLKLSARDSGGDPEVLAGGTKAWADHQHWPQRWQQGIAKYNVEALVAFIGTAIAAHRKKYYTDEAWAKLSLRTPEERAQIAAAWHELFLEVRDAPGDDPAGVRAQSLLDRWLELSERSNGGDPVLKEAGIKAWEDRENWPAARKPFLGAFQFEKIAEFMQKAAKHRAKKRPR
ncbi:MAG TPA: MerR family transcriptional regulator [Bryobacteraceae bacterium]|nr:MerR family transcriptional regulator [Bryobacteraceae bacterium]